MEGKLSSEVKEEICSLGVDMTTDPGFKAAIKDLCGENVLSCYQCGECTAGCPAAFSMDIAPNQVIRKAQLGLKDQVLSSSAIWLCAGCDTCAIRCPRGVALSNSRRSPPLVDGSVGGASLAGRRPSAACRRRKSEH
jgi:heterodisulfide reductase subunit C